MKKSNSFLRRNAQMNQLHRAEENGFRHSGFYHRFFEGYSEETIPGKGGKRERILRTYVGNYYQRKCSNRAWVLIKAAYIVLYLAAAAAFLFALTRPVKSNTAWYVAAPGLLSVISMLLLAAKITACAAAERKMRIYDFRYVFQRLFAYCAATAVCMCTTAVMMVLYMILNLHTDGGAGILACLSCLLGAGIILSTGLIERTAEYECIPNPTVPREGSMII